MMQANNPSYAHIAEQLIAHATEKSVLVDAGCGHNEFKNIYNKKIIGMNLNFNNKVNFVSNGQILALKNDSVNIFISNFVLEHVEDTGAYLAELHRALRPGGKLILSVPLPIWYVAHLTLPHTWHDVIANFPRFLRGPLKFLTHGHPHRHSFFYEFFEWSCRNYERAFYEAGFNIVNKKKTCDFLSLNTHLAKIFGRFRFPDFLNIQITYVLEKPELGWQRV